MINESFQIWNGIYCNLQSVPKIGCGFDSQKWLEVSRQNLKIINQNSVDGSGLALNTTPLHLVVPVLCKSGCVLSILDFGGGLGLTYTHLMSVSAGNTSFKFTVVEGEKVCKEGRRIFKDNENIEFITALPSRKKSFDIVHLGSSIQYIDCWQSLLSELASYEPNYIVFSDVPAASIPTFATSQKYYDSEIPCWFFNEKEFCEHITGLGYELIFQSLYEGNILGRYKGYPLENFPQKYQIGKSRNYIFRKKEMPGEDN